MLFNYLMIKNYPNKQDKYVYPLIIHEKDKDRVIVTYNKDNNGYKLRSFHESFLKQLKKYPSSKYSYAYKKGYCTKDAILDHLNSTLFIKLDIKSFFESIDFDSFVNETKEAKLKEKKLKCCFYDNHLSLGFVTSPQISDMYLYKFDLKMEEFLETHPTCKYSRYCDDILISTSERDYRKLHIFLSYIKNELYKYNLTINDKKLREFDLKKDTAVSFLGLNISPSINGGNKITISKLFILKTLDLLKHYYKYLDKEDDKQTLKERFKYIKEKNLKDKDPYVIETKRLHQEYKKNYNRNYKRVLFSTISSRISYIKHNSEYSYEKFLQKHFNKFGFAWKSK